MKDQLLSLFFTLASILVAATIAAINKWQQSVKSQDHRDNIEALSAAIEAAVLSLKGSVDDLKDPGKSGNWDETSQHTMQKKAIEIASIIAKPAIDALMARSGLTQLDVHKIMRSMLEASVYTHRTSVLEEMRISQEIAPSTPDNAQEAKQDQPQDPPKSE